VSLVHGLWTIGTPAHCGPASIAGQRSSSVLGLRPLQGSRPTAKGRGGVSGKRETQWAAPQSMGGGEVTGRRRRGGGS
jgi:hypothetical protein